MSVIAKSEKIALLFHCQMLNIFFITTSGFNTGFKYLIQVRVTVLFVLYRRELCYEFERKRKRSSRSYIIFFLLFAFHNFHLSQTRPPAFCKSSSLMDMSLTRLLAGSKNYLWYICTILAAVFVLSMPILCDTFTAAGTREARLSRCQNILG